ncbi:MAG TPA: hypothetical protein VMW07_04035 [Gallionella sp.]|nr:hypothetical protein [Gallionella sp.]
MADERTPQEQVADGYNKVAYGIPYDRELEAMNEKQLDIEIERSEESSARRSALQREKERRSLALYVGGPTWVDREYDPYFMELPPDEKFCRTKSIGRWLREHVLAKVVSGIILVAISTILVFYITQWLKPTPEASRPLQQEAKPQRT